MGSETSKCHQKRIRLGHFEKYLTGNGLDVGAGNDPLKSPVGTVTAFDKMDGDAQTLSSIASESFDFVYSSHCLEHIRCVEDALKNWARVLKPGGHLYLTVPDFILYEKGCFPSRFNSDHKHTFSLDIDRASTRRRNHWHVGSDIRSLLDNLGLNLISASLEDDNYNYSLSPGIDQTHSKNTLAQICIISEKRHVRKDSAQVGVDELFGGNANCGESIASEVPSIGSVPVTDKPVRIYTGILGQIGDIVMFTATARRLKELFPKSHLTFAVNRKYREVGDLISGLPYIDKVFVTELYFEKMKGARALCRMGWPVDLRGEDEIAEQATHDLVFETRPRHRRKSWWKQAHQVAECAHMVGVPGPISLKTEISIPKRVRPPVDSKDKVVLHNDPSISTRKEWPWPSVRKLVDLLEPTRTILLGRPGPPVANALDYRGKTTLPEAAEVIANAGCYVGIDSGLMWIAGSLEVPTVGLYGTSYIPAFEAIQPVNPNAFYFQSDGTLGDISADAVYLRVLEKIRRRNDCAT